MRRDKLLVNRFSNSSSLAFPSVSHSQRMAVHVLLKRDRSAVYMKDGAVLCCRLHLVSLATVCTPSDLSGPPTQHIHTLKSSKCSTISCPLPQSLEHQPRSCVGCTKGVEQNCHWPTKTHKAQCPGFVPHALVGGVEDLCPLCQLTSLMS